MARRRDGIEDECKKNNEGEGTDSRGSSEGKEASMASMVLQHSRREGGVSEWYVEGWVYLSFNLKDNFKFSL